MAEERNEKVEHGREGVEWGVGGGFWVEEFCDRFKYPRFVPHHMNQPEEHYVLFLAERSRPGLTVMTATAYDELKEREPEFEHAMVGEFFSEVTLDGLVKAVADALTIPEQIGKELGIEGANQPVRVVDQQEDCTEMGDYVIREEKGARVYAAKTHSANAKPGEIEFVYEMVAYHILDCLVKPDDTRGTAAQLLARARKEMPEVLDMVEQMRQVTRETGESLEGLRKDLKVINAGLDATLTEIKYGKPDTRYIN